MLQILTNVADGYTDAATLTPNANIRTISVQVSAPNFAICQVANKIVGGRPVFDQSEQAIQPGPITFQGVYGIRFRNFTPGKVAVVQANAYFVGEAVPEGNLPSNVVFTTAGQTGGGLTSNVAPTPLASFPPAAPNDGDICVLELPSAYDPVGGKKIRWILQYNASDLVWDFLGGPPLYAEVQTQENDANAAYGDLATIGPVQTIPRAGDYIISVGHGLSNNTGNIGFMAYSGAGISASDADAAATENVTLTAEISAVRERMKTSLNPAGSSVTAKYRFGNNSVFHQHRWMRITPVRIT